MRLCKVIFVSVLALLAQLKFGQVGIGLENGALLALIGAAFVLSWSELFALAAAAAWILNVQPGISAELLFILLLPFAVRFAREFFPAVPFVSFLCASGIGVGVWYAAADVRFVAQFGWLLLLEIVTGMWWAALLYFIMKNLSLFKT